MARSIRSLVGRSVTRRSIVGMLSCAAAACSSGYADPAPGSASSVAPENAPARAAERPSGGATTWRPFGGETTLASWLPSIDDADGGAPIGRHARDGAFPYPTGAAGGAGGATAQGDDACAPFRFTPTIDGSLSDWLGGPPGMTLNAFHGGTGYFAYDASNLYFACNMAPAGEGFAVTVYVGDGSSTNGGTTALLPEDTCTTATNVLPDGTNAKYAFTMHMGTGVVTAWAWNAANAAWAPATFTGTSAATPAFELSVPLSEVGNLTRPNVVGALVQNVGVTDCATPEFAGAVDGWPGQDGIYVHYAAADMTSCAAPNADIVPP